MRREEIVARLSREKIVAVIRADNADEACRVSEACMKGGVSLIEVTFTVPQAHKVIEQLYRSFSGSGLLIGAGTVLDPETARIAQLSGASFIVSPNFNEDTVRLCNRYRIPSIPGALTPSETARILESGADMVKIFPGDVVGMQMVKDILGPFPQASVMVTGNVTLDNLRQWLAAGVTAMGVGGAMTGPAKHGDYRAVEENARKFHDAVAGM